MNRIDIPRFAYEARVLDRGHVYEVEVRLALVEERSDALTFDADHPAWMSAAENHKKRMKDLRVLPVPPPISMRTRLLLFRVFGELVAWCVRSGWLGWVRKKGDRGAGDTIARIVGWALVPVSLLGKPRLPLPLWAAIYKAASGECGSCGDIQGKLNERFKYKITASIDRGAAVDRGKETN